MSGNKLHALARKDVLQLGVYNAGFSDEAVRKTWQIDTLSRLASNENPLGASARVTAALVALNDQQHVRDSASWVIAQRQWLTAQLRDLALQIAPSEANFLFFRIKGNAAELAKKLLSFGIIVKPWLEPGYCDWLRVSVGSAADNQRFIAALRQVL